MFLSWHLSIEVSRVDMSKTISWGLFAKTSYQSTGARGFEQLKATRKACDCNTAMAGNYHLFLQPQPVVSYSCVPHSLDCFSRFYTCNFEGAESINNNNNIVFRTCVTAASGLLKKHFFLNGVQTSNVQIRTYLREEVQNTNTDHIVVTGCMGFSHLSLLISIKFNKEHTVPTVQGAT